MSLRLLCAPRAGGGSAACAPPAAQPTPNRPPGMERLSPCPRGVSSPPAAPYLPSPSAAPYPSFPPRRYGMDRRDGKDLAQLLQELGKLEGLRWIRLLCKCGRGFHRWG